MSPISSRKSVPAVGLLELPAFHGRCTGEGALFVPEQFAFDQRFRNRRTVDRHKRLIGSGAVQMDRPRHQLLAGPVLTTDQYAAVGRTSGLRSIAAIVASRATVPTSSNFRWTLVRSDRFSCSNRYWSSACLTRSVTFSKDKRLFDVVIRPQFDGLDGGFDRPVPGHHHDLRRRAQFFHTTQGFQAIHFRHPNIEHHQIGRIRQYRAHCLIAVLGHRHLIPFILAECCSRR